MTEQQYRATDSEWDCIKPGVAVYSTILELRDRIEALEATQHAHIDLSHLSDAEREKMARWIANPGTFEALEVAQPAKPNYPAKPDSSLMGRVAAVIENGTACDREPSRTARDTIREIAVWMRENPDVYFPPALVFALEQETRL